MARRQVSWFTAGAMALLAACSGGSTGAPVESTEVTAPAATTLPPDRVLRIGLLLPATGAGATLGTSLSAGARLAIDEINAGGGVLHHDVELREADEGADGTSGAAGLGKLLDEGVDAIVGPASSRVAFEILGRAVRARVAVCSPANTAIGLTSFPDQDLYFRTMPSDALEAETLAQRVEETGETSAAVVAPDDDFGAAYAEALGTALRSRGITVTASVRFDPEESGTVDDVAQRVVDSKPANIVVIGSGDSGAAMLAAVRQLDAAIPVFVNDDFRSPTVVSALGERAPEVLHGVLGAAPAADPASSSFRNAFASTWPAISDDFAAYAYDCVNLIATAAAAADSDAAVQFVTQLTDISNGGDQCRTVADCTAQLALGHNINLEGASGPLDLSRRGDVLPGRPYQRFSFDERGTPVNDSAAGDTAA